MEARRIVDVSVRYVVFSVRFVGPSNPVRGIRRRPVPSRIASVSAAAAAAAKSVAVTEVVCG